MGLFGFMDGRRAAKFGDSVGYADALAVLGDTDLGLQDVRIQLEQDIARDLLLYTRG